MTNPNQLKDLVAGSCLLDLRLLENCKQFSTSRLRCFNLLKLLYEGYFDSRSRSRLSDFTKSPLDGQNGDMLKIASLFQSAGNQQAITTNLFC